MHTVGIRIGEEKQQNVCVLTPTRIAHSHRYLCHLLLYLKLPGAYQHPNKVIRSEQFWFGEWSVAEACLLVGYEIELVDSNGCWEHLARNGTLLHTDFPIIFT